MQKRMDPDDKREFQEQVAAEPKQWHVDWIAHPPEVKIENEIFPRPHEIYNCTTCRRGLEIPRTPHDQEEYACRCKWDLRLHIGPRWNDTGCRYWDRKDPRPRKGYMPGVES